MNQEKIGQIIKEIRLKNNLSQQVFAEKFGVTYQAVSKWENGKNIPDIVILKQICEEYNLKLEDLLDAKITNKKKNNWIMLAAILVSIIIGITIGIVLIFGGDGYKFKTLTTDCSDFNVSGSIAYDNNKTSIYISHITYCGEIDNNKYKTIKLVLYNINDKVKTEIGQYNYDGNSITLEEFLKEANFNIETCQLYLEESLNLEITAETYDGKILFHEVPLKLEDNCIDTQP